MTDTQRDIWETYVRSWKVASGGEKKALFAESVAEDCVYTDPLMVASGWEELAAYMKQFHEQVPGGHFVTQHFQAHHGECIARWKMMSGDGEELGDGISHGRFGDDGKLTAMTGFFEAP